MREFLKFLLSLSVAVLVTAAGLVFDALALTYFGLGLIAVTSTAWLVMKLHPAFAKTDVEDLDRKRELIKEGRQIATRHTQISTEIPFRHYIEGHAVYPHLRPHLGRKFLSDLNNGRIIIAQADGARMDALAERLLNELDRLEAEWGLR
jgi:hypothetical protein